MQDTYHSRPEISASQLKVLARSPLHFWDDFRNPDRPPDEPTPAMLLGTWAHCAILEPAEFDRRYIVMPDGIDRRTKEGKALYDEIQASGKTPVPADKWHLVRGMLNAAHRDPVLSRLINHPLAEKEREIYWRCTDTGVQCRMKADILIPPCDDYQRGLIVDVKTTPNASPDTSPAAFPRRVWDGNMLIQVGHYSRGFASVYGCQPEWMWSVVENDRPFCVKNYRATDSQIGFGIDESLRLLRIYSDCNAADHWPAYGDTVDLLELPVWAQRVIDGDGEEITGIEYV